MVVVEDAGVPTSLTWRGRGLPVRSARRWHERPPIPWWRSLRRLDRASAAALVDRERWCVEARLDDGTGDGGGAVLVVEAVRGEDGWLVLGVVEPHVLE
ncbi:hypothetical protein GCM10023225_33820 [Kineococcus glutinatus]|uniref:DUF6504 domain-containing protein n=1 Tax=Kineococcus glutinatus TaxID=1070872 RepID=A0ABP8VF61_9ACTN